MIQPRPLSLSLSASDILDAAFRLTGETLPLDHGYPLFAAISSVLPALHGAEPARVGVHPVFGHRRGPGVLGLEARSWLKLRIPATSITEVLPLVGQVLDVAGHRIQIGAPSLHALVPAGSLKSRFVTIKKFHEDPGEFREAVSRQLAALGIDLAAGASLEIGPRRVQRIAEHTIVGFPVAVHGLTAEGSLALQRLGVGGRRHMGAGLFVPFGKRS